MDFNSLRYNLQQPYQQKNWKEWLLELFGQQISIETQAEKIVVQKGNAITQGGETAHTLGVVSGVGQGLQEDGVQALADVDGTEATAQAHEGAVVADAGAKAGVGRDHGLNEEIGLEATAQVLDAGDAEEGVAAAAGLELDRLTRAGLFNAHVHRATEGHARLGICGRSHQGCQRNDCLFHESPFRTCE